MLTAENGSLGSWSRFLPYICIPENDISQVKSFYNAGSISMMVGSPYLPRVSSSLPPLAVRSKFSLLIYLFEPVFELYFKMNSSTLLSRLFVCLSIFLKL